jgi:hypothetical protein
MVSLTANGQTVTIEHGAELTITVPTVVDQERIARIANEFATTIGAKLALAVG